MSHFRICLCPWSCTKEGCFPQGACFFRCWCYLLSCLLSSYEVVEFPRFIDKSKMVKLNVYGRGRLLRMAIMFTCQLAFIFFGESLFYPVFGYGSHTVQAMTRACSPVSWATRTSWRWCTIPAPGFWGSSCRSTIWAVSPVRSSRS